MPVSNSLLCSPSPLPAQTPDIPDRHQKGPREGKWQRGVQHIDPGGMGSRSNPGVTAEASLLPHARSCGVLPPMTAEPPQDAQSWYYWVQNLNAINVISWPTCSKIVLIQNGERTSHVASVAARMPRLWKCPWENLLLVKTSSDALLNKTSFQLLMFWHQTRTSNRFLFYSNNYFTCLWKGNHVRMRKKARQDDLAIPKLLCRDIAVMQ